MSAPMKTLLPFGVMQYSYSVTNEQTYRENFFKSLRAGEDFRYYSGWMGDEVVAMAAKYGVTCRVLNPSEAKGEFACRVLEDTLGHQTLEGHYASLDPQAELDRMEKHLKVLAAKGCNSQNSPVYAIYEDTVAKIKVLLGK